MPKKVNITSFLENFTEQKEEIEVQILDTFSNIGDMPEDVFISNLLIKDSQEKKEFFFNDIFLFQIIK